LSIDGDSDRLAMTLVRIRADAEPRRVFVGACPLLDTRPLGSALRRADSAQGAGRHPGRDIKMLGSVLARTLPRELRRGLARVPERESIEIACSTAATRLPWEWLVIAGRPLALRNPTVPRPVDVTAQARGRRSVKPRPRLLVIGDAGGGNSRRDTPLHFAELEAATIERLFCRGLRGAEVTRLSLERATHRRVLQEIESGDYDVIHFAGHAWFDEREAYFFLWDRIMLGSELAPLLSRRPPALMMLDTHFTAFVLAEADTTAYEIAGTPDATRALHHPAPLAVLPRRRCAAESAVSLERLATWATAQAPSCRSRSTLSSWPVIPQPKRYAGRAIAPRASRAMLACSTRCSAIRTSGSWRGSRRWRRRAPSRHSWQRPVVSGLNHRRRRLAEQA
jgi:hypothetical protein